MAGSEAPIIRIRDLETRFGDQVVHRGLNLDVWRREALGVVGGSGSGKTTLLRAMIMLLRPFGGSVQLFGQDIAAMPPSEAYYLRQRLGVTFQRGALFSALTVAENVAMPLHEHSGLGRRLIGELARLKIALVGLASDAAAKYPPELSGGMLKRAAVARALALDPELLFLDEPTAGLDPVSANALDELIVRLKQALGLTVVLVTHDLDSLARVTDRIAFLGAGGVLGTGSLDELAAQGDPTMDAYFNGPRGRAARSV